MNHIVDYRAWFDPSTIAVVGASNRSGSAGRSYVRALTTANSDRDIWVVHPSGEDVVGQRAFTEVAALPSPPDLAIIAVPAALVADVVGELGVAGCQAVHVFSGGFAELGTVDGVTLQRELEWVASSTGVAVLGPNCMGIHRPSSGLTFRSDLPLVAGSVGIVSQSGGTTINLIQLLAERGIGTSAAVSFGNAVNRGAAYWTEAIASLPETGPMVVYVESGGDPDLVDRLSRLALERAVFLLRPEGDEHWRAAAARHTGAPGSAALPDIRNVTVVHDLVELSDRLELDVRGPGPLAAGTVFVTISGGMGVLAAGAFAAHGHPLRPLASELRLELEALEPSGLVAAHNPVDLGPRFLSRRLLKHVIESIARRDESRPVVVHVPWDSVREIDTVQPGYAEAFLGLLGQLSNATSLVAYLPALGLDGEAGARRALRTSGVPVVTTLTALTGPSK